ncbi:insulinase family protein [Staphylococcus pseudintermedius]|nr:insulinase family protein [Staphylococcus pseudintermedius]MDE9862846.1 insulinase family protein [Staphylococcus pseudintermedius]
MKVTKLFYADLDQNLYNLFQNEIKVTYFNKSDSYINQIKAVVNIGGYQYQTGAAHFIEHLKFWKENNNLYDLMNYFGTIMNANTTEYETNFLLYCSKENTVSTLTNFTSYLLNHSYTIEEFNKEKKIILNEVKGYHSILVDENEKLEYVKKIIGDENQINDISKRYLENLSSIYYQKRNIHYYLIGDFSEYIHKSREISMEKIELVVNSDLIIHDYDNTELFLKTLYFHINKFVNYYFQNKSLVVNFNKLYYTKKIHDIQLDDFRSYIISYIVNVYEDSDLLIEFLENWKFTRGDFTKIGNLLEDQEKLSILLNEAFM